jgi:hypothetical protein
MVRITANTPFDKAANRSEVVFLSSMARSRVSLFSQALPALLPE